MHFNFGEMSKLNALFFFVLLIRNGTQKVMEQERGFCTSSSKLVQLERVQDHSITLPQDFNECGKGFLLYDLFKRKEA